MFAILGMVVSVEDSETRRLETMTKQGYDIRRHDGSKATRTTVESELRRVEKNVSESVRKSTERLTEQYTDTLKELSKS